MNEAAFDFVKQAEHIDHNNAIRSDFLSGDKLADLAANISQKHEVALPGFEPFVLKSRLKENEAAILEAFRSTVKAFDEGVFITPAAEWLLDNHYLVEENIRQVRRALPRRFYQVLPTITVEGGIELPRTVALAWLYIAHSHSCVSVQTLTVFIDGFQSGNDLMIGELWALPSILRYVLIENLRRVLERVQ